jgi:hypothetical protein
MSTLIAPQPTFSEFTDGHTLVHWRPHHDAVMLVRPIARYRLHQVTAVLNGLIGAPGWVCIEQLFPVGGSVSLINPRTDRGADARDPSTWGAAYEDAEKNAFHGQPVTYVGFGFRSTCPAASVLAEFEVAVQPLADPAEADAGFRVAAFPLILLSSLRGLGA